MVLAATRIAATTADGVEDSIRCPNCFSGVASAPETWTCRSSNCAAKFPVVEGVPVLLKRPGECRRVRAESGWSRVLPSLTAHPVSEANYRHLARLLRSLPAPRRVLVVGGATHGTGIEALRLDASVELVETDLAIGPLTRYVADAHDLPFADESFDAVVLQAVLEHLAEPARAVAEGHRVLRKGGLVYAETAFMQQVHAGAADFSRFTDLGHRRLFRNYREIDRGAACGPGTTLAWAYMHLILSLAGSGWGRKPATAFARLSGFWLKYFDYLVAHRPEAIDAASSVYFLGIKQLTVVEDDELPALYRGAQST